MHNPFETKLRSLVIACCLTIVLLGCMELPSLAGEDDELQGVEQELDKPRPDKEIFDRLAAFLQKHPTSARGHFLLGKALEKAGYNQLAIEHYELADKYNPSDSQSILESFKIRMDTGDLEGALHVLSGAEKRFPQDPSIMVMQGTYLQHTGKVDEAEALFQKVLKLGKRQVGTATALGEIRVYQKRYMEAIRLADQDLAISPGYYAANSVKGQAYYELGRYREAIPPLEQAFRTSPYQSLIPGMLADSYERIGRKEDALEAALYNLAIAVDQQSMFKRKRYLERLIPAVSKQALHTAIEKVSKRVDKTAFGARFHLALGDVFDHLRRPDEAVEQFKTGLALSPNFARGIFRLGKLYERYYHDYDQALNLYERALKADPIDTQISDSYKRLSERLKNRKRDVAWRIKDWLQKKK